MWLQTQSKKVRVDYTLDEEQFYTMEYVARDLEISKEVLLVILDEVIVLPKSNKKDDSDIYPTGVNFGLNVINVCQGLIVPEFARCQMEYENTKDAQRIFDYVELS